MSKGGALALAMGIGVAGRRVVAALAHDDNDAGATPARRPRPPMPVTRTSTSWARRSRA
ncbi:MAG: hypothetical protein QM775_32640 [Pirellulales bacterium]